MHGVIKVAIFLYQREVVFLSPSKICENLNFSTVHPENCKFSQILLGDKNAAYLCSNIISTLPRQMGITQYLNHGFKIIQENEIELV